MDTKTDPIENFKWATPDSLNIPADKLRFRLDFHHQAVVAYSFDGDSVQTKVVSALDVAHHLSSELSFSTGLLPPDTLWWRNTSNGPVYAIYVQKRVWRVALQLSVSQPPRRYELPMPGLIFLCTPGRPPWVYAVKKKPTKDSDDVYNAPLTNLHQNGRSCGGNHHYPTRAGDIPNSFFISFFTATDDLSNRSIKYPKNIVSLWNELDGKKTYPMNDLVRIATIKDLQIMEM